MKGRSCVLIGIKWTALQKETNKQNKDKKVCSGSEAGLFVEMVL